MVDPGRALVFWWRMNMESSACVCCALSCLGSASKSYMRAVTHGRPWRDVIAVQYSAALNTYGFTSSQFHENIFE